MPFFRKWDSFFKSPSLPKKLFQKLSWAWNLKFPTISVNKLFKFQAQGSYLEYFLEIWRFEKRIALSEKKSPLVEVRVIRFFFSIDFCTKKAIYYTSPAQFLLENWNAWACLGLEPIFLARVGLGNFLSNSSLVSRDNLLFCADVDLFLVHSS